MIRLGIVGCNYGRAVLLPAFRADPRCEVVALAGTNAARTAELANESGIPQAFGDWKAMIEQANIDAVAIAVPPLLQAEIAIAALKHGKALFLEKPVSGSEAGHYAVKEQAKSNIRPVAVDFEFAELPTWRRAKELIDAGALGTLRHVVVTWNVENYATRMRLKNWKTTGGQGGGVVGNLCSHSFYYLENFCGPMRDIAANLFGLPDEDRGNASESTAVITGSFQSGASYSLTVSAASYLGSGHRIEFYGEDGTLVLVNTTTDYMRGFKLFHARRPATSLEQIEAKEEEDIHADGRIAPVSRLARRFFDAIENGGAMTPGLTEGLRVDRLISWARFSHTISGEGVILEDP